MRRRRAQPNPMRLLVMLGVMWAAGSLLFAAESSPPARERAQQAAQTQQTQPQPEAQGQATAPASAPAPASEGAPAQPAADDSQEAPEADAAPASTPDRDSEEQQGRDEAGATAKKDSTAAGRAPRRFVPSEQVRADFDVSFPIDI